MGKKYDIVIIGSGLGGLLCGAILSKNGYSVCILEKHAQVGGNIQTFKRKGCVFSAGMHFIGAMEKGQILYDIFNYINIADKIQIKKLDESSFEQIYYGDKVYRYAQGMENFKNTLISHFPEEKSAIEQYGNKLDEIWNAINVLNLKESDNDFVNQMESLDVSAYEYINSLTNNKELRAVLSATNGLYGGVKDKTPLHVHALINNFFIKSAWKLDEREITFAEILSESVKLNGGDIFTKQEVVHFSFDDDKIVSVETKEGNLYTGAQFISNIHPSTTIELVGKDRFRKAFISRVFELENSISSFGLYIVLKKNTFKNINSDVYFFNDEDVWGVDSYDPKNWPKGFVMYTSSDKNNEEYAESLSIITYMKYDDVKQWENTKVGRRGDEYLNFKKERAEKILDMMAQKYADIRDCIDSYYTSTPLTYRDYTGIPEGSMYGVMKDYKNHLNSFMTPKTKVPNLFLTGQNIQMHGILGVTVCAIHTCSCFIDYNELINKIKNG